MKNQFFDLAAFLDREGAGRIEDASTLIPLLESVWHLFDGSDEERMYASKLRRLESPHWTPPVLSFLLERHGAMVGGGSTRADVQRWSVNLETAQATISCAGRRQIEPMAPRLRLQPLVDEIVEKVTTGAEDERLKWVPPDQVKVKMGNCIPNIGFKQTVASRRERFRASLTAAMESHGWADVGWPTFERRES